MLRLTDDARRFVSQLSEHSPELDLTCLNLVSPRQLEAVTYLLNVQYNSRCSFQENRYHVSFFEAHEGESVKDFLIRKSVASGTARYIPHVLTDESHEPNGLVLMPDGSLAIFCDAEKQIVIYSSIEQIIERDSILDLRSKEHVGTITFKPKIDQQRILSQFQEFEIFEAASDNENQLVQCVDGVCLLQWWHHHYAPNFLSAERTCTMRVFSSDSSSFHKVQKQFDRNDFLCAVPSQ